MYRKLPQLLLVLFVMIITSCSKDDDANVFKGRYDNGFFLINEGSYNNVAGNVHFYSYTNDSLYLNAYTTENPGKTLGTNTQVLEFATIFNNKLFLVVNLGGPIVLTDPYTLKETARINSLPNGDMAHAFVGVDASRGLLSTTAGIYPVDLSAVTVGTKITGISEGVGDMIKAGNYIFVLSETSGIIALNSSDYSIAKTIGPAKTGFAISKDGDVWAATTNSLLKINPGTLKVDTINTTFDIYYNPYTYTSGSIVASTTENAIYVTSDYNAVYKYVVGNNASIATPFITIPADHFFYGKGIAYNPQKNTLMLSTTDNVYGGSINTMYSYNASTGVQTGSFIYNGNYYPAMTVFH
ncbi:protein of unknown function [Chitinophaga sp. YR573]|uniref:DUF5074 domain-containing protein n=1 Tax=Chitinophaga sp. YR573 TaxID=1881040 RepID=UPI0008B3F14A|nr:DUF5074 domain-containing protein [Chitinophaga sp. YR573]SEW46750.1 protein of unknown function [Chitinophaga sp. YR573]